MAEMRPPCSLPALAMVNALGRELDEIWPRLIRGDQAGFRAHEDLIPGRKLVVAGVSGVLPAGPDRLRRYAVETIRSRWPRSSRIEKPLSTDPGGGPDRSAS